MKLIEEKLASLEKAKQEKNSATLVFSEIDNLIKNSITKTIQEANETDSIDASIKLLVSGFQEIMDTLNSYGSSFAASNQLLDVKISVLEELIDDYLKDQINEND